MNRKNAFSYIMWFVYSMAVCVGLFVLASTLSMQAGYSGAVGYGIGGAWLAVCGLIVFFLHKFAGNFMDVGEKGRIPALVAESLIAVILFAVGIVLRIQGLAGAGEDAAYFEMAKVAEGQSIPAVVHGASYIYLHLLHLVCVIFGNKLLAGVWLQIVLQMIAGLCVYRAVRKSAGVTPALIALGFMTVGPLMVGESLMLSPEMLFLTIYGLALYVCMRCIHGNKGIVSCILTGLLVAVVCYLDILGATLLILVVLGLLYEQSDDELTVPARIVRSLVALFSSCIGFALLLLVDSLISGKVFVNVLAAWWELYAPSAFSVPEVLKITGAGVDVMLLLLLMVLGIFSHWCNLYRERQSIWVMLATMLVLLLCFDMTTVEVNGYLILYMVFAILAGVGIVNIVSYSDDDDDMKPLNKVSKKEKTVKVQPEVREELKVKEESDVKEEPKVKLLENPLPLPKKHEKKILDYDIRIAPGKFHYDVDVAEDDDFDI